MINYTILIMCIATLETGGHKDLSNAIGDGGKAYGKYQQHEIFVKDVNRIAGTSYEWPKDSMNDATAEAMVVIYLTHYGKGTQDVAKLGAIYNGGPRGPEKPNAIGYGRRLKKLYDKEQGE